MKHLIVIFCALSTAFAQINRQLIGGQTTSITNAPFMAGIYNNGNFFVCGGAIINFRSVLTAAHCIFVPTQDIQVNVGATRSNGVDGTFFRVANIFIHPDYRGVKTVIISDLAVIRTIFPFAFGIRVRPISLGTSNAIGSNERVTISGWGSTRDNGDTAEILQTLNMMTISNNLCASMHADTSVRGWITSEKICTVGNQLDSGICAGDSGSPLILRNAVIGIASWTVRPCANHPSVFIRVSNHLAWIRQNL